MIKNKNPLISIIIPQFNDKDLLAVCLKSIFQNTYTNFEIIVVDNGSNDQSVEWLREKYHGKILLIANKDNLGYAPANNQGANRAKGEILFFLNNDTRMDKNCLNEIIEIFKKDRKNGIIVAGQCKIKQINHPNHIQTVGSKLALYFGFLVGFPGNRKIDEGQYDKITDIFPAGAAMIIRKDIFKKLGGFDPDYFVGFEDIDLSWRIFLAKKRVVLFPGAIVYHHDKSSHILPKKRAAISFCQTTKNAFSFAIKNYEAKNLLLALPLIFLYHFLVSCAALTVKSNPYHLIGFLKGLFWTIKNLSRTLKKRKTIQVKIRKIPDCKMNHLFVKNPFF